MSEILDRARRRLSAAAETARAAVSRSRADLAAVVRDAKANTDRAAAEATRSAGALERPAEPEPTPERTERPAGLPPRRDPSATLLRLGSEEDEEFAETRLAAPPRRR